MRLWLKDEHLEKTFIEFTYLQQNISTNREKKKIHIHFIEMTL